MGRRVRRRRRVGSLWCLFTSRYTSFMSPHFTWPCWTQPNNCSAGEEKAKPIFIMVDSPQLTVLLWPRGMRPIIYLHLLDIVEELDLDQGVDYGNVFPCKRYRLAACDCVHKEFVKVSLISEDCGYFNFIMSHLHMQHSGTTIIYKRRQKCKEGFISLKQNLFTIAQFHATQICSSSVGRGLP